MTDIKRVADGDWEKKRAFKIQGNSRRGIYVRENAGSSFRTDVKELYLPRQVHHVCKLDASRKSIV
jgi:hypothetical protein